MRRCQQGAALSMTQVALRVLAEMERRLRAEAGSAQAASDGESALNRARDAQRLREAAEILKDRPLPP